MNTHNSTYLFIDESGDHGLSQINSDFPVFVLCGILIDQNNYETLNKSFNALKKTIWGGKNVIFHSRDIRKCDREFQVLFDLELKRKFYAELNFIIQKNYYSIIASAIRKDKFIEKFGKLQDDVYEIALSFIIEQTIISLNDNFKSKNLNILIEKRGRREDKRLDDHFQKIMGKGTGKISPEELNLYEISFNFRDKKENINGLQLADLLAYPIARFIIDPNTANPSFDVFASKIYQSNKSLDGLRIFP
jgi:hypothetical protein